MTVTVSGTSGVSLCATNSVPTAAIQDAAVASAKIQDAAVSQLKIGSGVAGNGPAFHAYGSGSQVISSGTQTTIQFPNELFDTNNCFDVSTYRFTPTVAGYYQFNVSLNVTSTISSAETFAYVMKNGTGYLVWDFGGSPWYGASGSVLLYANGTTDYFYVQFWQNSGASRTLTGASSTMFSGALVRAA